MWIEHPQTQFGIRVHQMKGKIQNSDFFSVIIAHDCQLHTFLLGKYFFVTFITSLA